MARAIGVDDLEIDHLGHGHFEPPPGLTRILLVGGPVAHMGIGLGRGIVDRAALDARFGEGRPLPRVDYDRPFVLAYDVAVDGAPARCAVFGHFDDEPKVGNVEASEVTLRIDPRFPEPLVG